MNTTIQVTLTSVELGLLVQDAVRIELAKYLSVPKVTEEKLLTAKQVAEVLGITLPTVQAYSLSGILKAYRMGRKVRYKSSELGLALTPFKL